MSPMVNGFPEGMPLTRAMSIKVLHRQFFDGVGHGDRDDYRGAVRPA